MSSRSTRAPCPRPAATSISSSSRATSFNYQGGGEELVITVLDDTEIIDGVTTRVVEERETRGGALAEVSRNYYAIDPATRDVYYFGEQVDEYSGGRVASHSGAWRSGAAGAQFGLMMPGEPRVGQKHYQEIAPDVAWTGPRS